MKKNFKLSTQLSNRASLRLQNSTSYLGVQSDKKKRGGTNYSSVQGISTNSLQYSSTNKESNQPTIDFKIEGEGVFKNGSGTDSSGNLGDANDNRSSHVQIKNLNSQQKLQMQNEEAINKKPKIVLTQNNSVTQKEKKFNFGKNKSSVVTVNSPGGQEIGKEIKANDGYRTPQKQPQPEIKEPVEQKSTTYTTEPALDKKPSFKKIVPAPKKDIQIDLKGNQDDIESEEEEVDPELVQYEVGTFIKNVVKNFEGEIEKKFQDDVDPSIITSFVKSELKNYEFNIHEGGSNVYTVGIPSEEVESESLRGSNLQNLENQLVQTASKETMELSNQMFGDDNDEERDENLSPEDLILEQKIKQELYYFIQEKISETHHRVMKNTEREIRDEKDMKEDQEVFEDNVTGMEDRIFQMVEDELDQQKNVVEDHDILAFVKNEVKGVGSFLVSDKAEVEKIDFKTIRDREGENISAKVNKPALGESIGAKRFSIGGLDDEISAFIQGETQRLLYSTQGSVDFDTPRKSKLDASNLGEIGEEDEDENEESNDSFGEEEE